MRESAKQVWERSRDEFLTGLSRDTAANLLFAGLNADRHTVRLGSGDLRLLEYATLITKQGPDRPLPPQPSGSYVIGGETVRATRGYGEPPVLTHAKLMPLVTHRDDYADYSVKDQQNYLMALASARPYTDTEVIDDPSLPHADRHPIEELGLFNGAHPKIPSSSMQYLYKHLYYDGAHKEFDDGLDAHEREHSDHPHNSPRYLGEWTGNLSRGELWQRGQSKWRDDYREKFGKEPDDEKARFFNHKSFEWEGYDPWELYDDDGNIPVGNSEKMLQAIEDHGPIDATRQLGLLSHLYGLEALEPDQRVPVMQWLMDDRPEDARHIFDEHGLGSHRDWVPWLNRQMVIRGARLNRALCAGPNSNAVANTTSDHSGTSPRDVGTEWDEKSLNEALKGIQVEENGEFSHYGQASHDPPTRSAYDHVMLQAKGQGLMGDDPMDEMAHSQFRLPNLGDDGKPFFKVDEKGRHRLDRNGHPTFNHINSYVANGLLDGEVLRQLFSDTEENQSRPFANRAAEERGGGTMLHDWMVGAVQPVQPHRPGDDVTGEAPQPSFSWMEDGPYATQSGMMLDGNSFMHILDESYPGVFTQPLSEMRLEQPAGEGEFEPYQEQFDMAFGRGVPKEARELREGFRGALGFMEPYSLSSAETRGGFNMQHNDFRGLNADSPVPWFIRQSSGQKLNMNQQPHIRSNSAFNHQAKWPGHMLQSSIFGALSRPLDKDDVPFGAHNLPIEHLHRKMRDPDWLMGRWPPYVQTDPHTGEPLSDEQGQAQLQDVLADAGLFTEGDPTRHESLVEAQRQGRTEAIPGSPVEGESGMFNIYNLSPNPLTGAQPFDELWDSFHGPRPERSPVEHLLPEGAREANAPKGYDPATGDLPTFDARDYLADDPESGEPLSDKSREDTARWLLQNVDESLLSGQPREPPMGITLPGASDSVVESGPNLQHAQRIGLWGADPNTGIPGRITQHGFLHEESPTKPQNLKFRLREDVHGPDQFAFMSMENPLNMMREHLTNLGTDFDGLSRHPLVGSEKYGGLRDLLERQQGLNSEVRQEFDPLELDDLGDRQQRHQAQLGHNVNDTYYAIEQILPSMKEWIEKRQPDAFKPETDEDGTENWNKAYVNALAAAEAAERFAMMRTDEGDKALGFSGPLMTRTSQPRTATRDVKDPDLHQRVSDFVSGGNDSMMHLLYDSINPDSAVFPKEGVTVPLSEGVRGRDDVVRDVIHHAVARAKAIDKHPEMFEHEHLRNERRKLTPAAKEWKNKVNEMVEDVTPEEVRRFISDRMHSRRDKNTGELKSEGLIDSLLGRHHYMEERPLAPGEKRRPGASRGWGSNSIVHKDSAKDEHTALKAALGELKKHLFATGWGHEGVRPPKRKGVQFQRVIHPLAQKLQEKEVEGAPDRPQPLHRVVDGVRNIMPVLTSKPMTREEQHNVYPSFALQFDHATGAPDFFDLSDSPMTDREPARLLNPPMSLLRTIEPKLQPMHTNGPAALSSFIHHVDTQGEDWGAAVLPHYAKRRGTWLQGGNRRSNRVKRSEPSDLMDALTHLNILKDDDEKREKGEAPPIKAAHRIFDLDDLEHLRGFSGEWVVNWWPEGQRVLIEKKDGKVTVSGEETTVAQSVLEQAKEIHEEDFTIDCIWDLEALHVVDLLNIAGDDLTDEPLKHRMRVLRGGFEANEGVNTPQPVNTRQTDDDGLKEAVDEIEEKRVMLRDAESTYMEGEARHPKWVLLDDEKRVAAIVLGQRGQRNAVYRLGIGPISDEAAEKLGNRAAKVGGENYMDVGSAGDGSDIGYDWDDGDFVQVSVGSVSRRERGGEPVYALHGAKLRKPAESQATDSFDTLDLLTKSGVPYLPHTVSVQQDRVIISLPMLGDDVVYKTQRLENESGVLLKTWRLQAGESTSDNQHSVRVAETLRPCWEPLAALMLKGMVKVDYDPRPYQSGKYTREGKKRQDKDEKEKEEVVPDPRPEDEKPKKIMPNQLLKDPVVVKALVVLEELLTKEKMTWTGPRGLGISVGTEDSAPRGPTELTRPETVPDFYPGEGDFEKPAKKKNGRSSRSITTEEGEKATLRVTDDEATLELRAD